MKATYNIYCDESCHLLNDRQKVFVLGAVWVEQSQTKQISEDLRLLKEKHSLSKTFEAKWTKVSTSKADYYTDLIKYFFENDLLHFRGVVVPDKTQLDHSAFAQDHNTWYYKMFYVLLNVITQRGEEYHLYLDIKDTKSNLKVAELKRILNITSTEDVAITKAQQVRSHEIEIMQITDLLCGALAYSHRGLKKNQGKNLVVQSIETNLGKKIINSSALSEAKFNVLVWTPKKRAN